MGIPGRDTANTPGDTSVDHFVVFSNTECYRSIASRFGVCESSHEDGRWCSRHSTSRPEKIYFMAKKGEIGHDRSRLQGVSRYFPPNDFVGLDSLFEMKLTLIVNIK